MAEMNGRYIKNSKTTRGEKPESMKAWLTTDSADYSDFSGKYGITRVFNGTDVIAYERDHGIVSCRAKYLNRKVTEVIVQVTNAHLEFGMLYTTVDVFEFKDLDIDAPETGDKWEEVVFAPFINQICMDNPNEAARPVRSVSSSYILPDASDGCNKLAFSTGKTIEWGYYQDDIAEENAKLDAEAEALDVEIVSE